jgi:hypothetical protein
MKLDWIASECSVSLASSRPSFSTSVGLVMLSKRCKIAKEHKEQMQRLVSSVEVLVCD